MLSKRSINKLDILKVPTAEAAMTLTAHLQNLDQMTRSKALIQRHDPTGPKTPSPEHEFQAHHPVKGLPNQGHSTKSHSVLFNANMLRFKMHTPKDYTCHQKIREATASKQRSMQVLLDSLWRMNGWKYLIQTSIWSIRFPLQCILVLSYVISIILLHHFDLPFGCTLPSIIAISTWSSQHLQWPLHELIKWKYHGKSWRQTTF